MTTSTTWYLKLIPLQNTNTSFQTIKNNLFNVTCFPEDNINYFIFITSKNPQDPTEWNGISTFGILPMKRENGK